MIRTGGKVARSTPANAAASSPVINLKAPSPARNDWTFIAQGSALSSMTKGKKAPVKCADCHKKENV
jgi:hypothetical protein